MKSSPDMLASRRLPFSMALVLALASGAAALSHELLWTRRLVDLIGGSAESTARVFGCFFLGLALGPWLAVPIARRTSRPWLAVALAEGSVAILALPVLLLTDWADPLWHQLGPEGLLSWKGAALKAILSLVVITPPAIAMGMVLPFLGRAVLRGRATLGRQGIWLYALNTGGGVIGLLVTAVGTLPLWGLNGAIIAAMAANLSVAAVAMLIDRFDSEAVLGVSSESAGPVATSRRKTATLLGWAFASGAGVLSAEVLAFHELAYVVPSAMQATTAILAAVILLLAVSAMLAAPLVRLAAANRILPWIVALTGIALTAVPIFFDRYTEGLSSLGDRTYTLAGLLQLVGDVAFTVGPALLLAGLVFPIVQAWFATIDPHGRRWGWLLAASGFGGIVGVEVTQRVLMPLVGPHVGFAVVGTGYVLLAIVAAVTAPATHRREPAIAFAVIAAMFVAVATPTYIAPLSLLGPSGDTKSEIVAIRSGREGVVAVTETPAGDRAIVLPGGYTLGSTSASLRERRQTHLPLLLHGDSKDIAFIALATGITAGAALDHADVESITVVEISEQVVWAAGNYFDAANAGICDDPRAEIIVEDGRAYLAACHERFDVVIGDFFLPWRAGTGRLHTVEHYSAVRRALRKGGMFCQWLPLFDMGREQADAIIATFVEAFPETHVFRGTFAPGDPVVALIGFREGEIAWQGLTERCSRLQLQSKLRDDAIGDAAGVAMLYMGTLTADDLQTDTINTLGNAYVELSAGQFRMQPDWLAGSIRGEQFSEFQRDYTRCIGGHELPLAELCRLGPEIYEYRLLRARGDVTAAHQQRLRILFEYWPEVGVGVVPDSLRWFLRD